MSPATTRDFMVGSARIFLRFLREQASPVADELERLIAVVDATPGRLVFRLPSLVSRIVRVQHRAPARSPCRARRKAGVQEKDVDVPPVFGGQRDAGDRVEQERDVVHLDRCLDRPYGLLRPGNRVPPG